MSSPAQQSKYRPADTARQPSSVITALTRLTIWAHFPGYAEDGAIPPELPAAELAAMVRVLLAQCGRLSDQTASALVAIADANMLRSAAEAYQWKLTALRAELDELRNPHHAAAEETPEAAAAVVQPATATTWANPEDAFTNSGKRRASRSGSGDDAEAG